MSYLVISTQKLEKEKMSEKEEKVEIPCYGCLGEGKRFVPGEGFKKDSCNVCKGKGKIIILKAELQIALDYYELWQELGNPVLAMKRLSEKAGKTEKEVEGIVYKVADALLRGLMSKELRLQLLAKLAKPEPIEVKCFDVPDEDIRNLTKDTVEIRHQKTGVWRRYKICHSFEDCPVCGKSMHVLVVKGSTWLACCSKECGDKFAEK